MTVKQAREAARKWIVEEAGAIPGFCGAYAAGSSNWLPEDAELRAASDLDIMVVLAGQCQPRPRRKFAPPAGTTSVAGGGLGDYHLAPSLRTAKILFDLLGRRGANASQFSGGAERIIAVNGEVEDD